jgi:hypothetical protein
VHARALRTFLIARQRGPEIRGGETREKSESFDRQTRKRRVANTRLSLFVASSARFVRFLYVDLVAKLRSPD